jgi:hypothetical protein
MKARMRSSYAAALNSQSASLARLAKNAVFETSEKSAPFFLFRIRIFTHSVHGRLSQPFPSFLSQLGGVVAAGADRGSFSN